VAENANCSSCIESGQLKEIDAFIDELAAKGSLDGKLIAILHRSQEILGYLPVEAQAHVARRLGIPPAKVYGVVSFYSFFSMVPKGKYVIDVCMGTACFVLGADKVLAEFSKILGIAPGNTTEDRMFTWLLYVVSEHAASRLSRSSTAKCTASSLRKKLPNSSKCIRGVASNE